jgi:hypothetical protein
LINRRDNNGIYNITKVSIIIMEVGKIANINERIEFHEISNFIDIIVLIRLK